MKKLVTYASIGLCIALVCIAGISAQEQDNRVLEAYSLGDVKYSDIEKTLMAVKTKQGSISYVKGANKVFVFDSPAVHKLVKKILAQSTKPAVNITVDIEFKNMRMIRDRGLKLGVSLVSDRTSGGGAKHRAKVDISARDQKTTVEKNNSMSLMVSSGRTGELWSTKEVVDTATLKRYGLTPARPGRSAETGKLEFPTDFVRALGTHMWIKPTYMPSGLVQVEIFPVVRAETTDGQEQYFRVASVRTVVTVQPGRRLFVGGTNSSMKQFFRDLFDTAATSKTSTDSLSIYLTATVRIMDGSGKPTTAPVRPNRDSMWKHFPDK